MRSTGGVEGYRSGLESRGADRGRGASEQLRVPNRAANGKASLLRMIKKIK